MLAEHEGARSSEKRLCFKQKALNHQLREIHRDLVHTAGELTATRMDDPNKQELELEVGQEVRKLKLQLVEFNCQD